MSYSLICDDCKWRFSSEYKVARCPECNSENTRVYLEIKISKAYDGDDLELI